MIRQEGSNYLIFCMVPWYAGPMKKTAQEGAAEPTWEGMNTGGLARILLYQGKHAGLPLGWGSKWIRVS